MGNIRGRLLKPCFSTSVSVLGCIVKAKSCFSSCAVYVIDPPDMQGQECHEKTGEKNLCRHCSRLKVETHTHVMCLVSKPTILRANMHNFCSTAGLCHPKEREIWHLAGGPRWEVSTCLLTGQRQRVTPRLVAQLSAQLLGTHQPIWSLGHCPNRAVTSPIG